MIKVKDLIDLIDVDRNGGESVYIKTQDSDNWDSLDTGSSIIDLLADFQIVGIEAYNRFYIQLRTEDFERSIIEISDR